MSEKKHPHFERLRELLRQEKEEDYRSFLQLVREKPLTDRVNEGYTWYPLKVLQTGFALGEKAFVLLERTTRLNEPHQLRAGQSVSLFTQAEHVDQPEKQGVINYVERNRIKIILNARDVPDWLDAGLLGVDMLFDDRSYREMERALEKVLAAKGDRLAELRDMTSPPQPPQRGGVGRSGSPRLDEPVFPTPPLLGGPGGANSSQRAAIHAILDNRDFAIMHGPPGTGKTTTLVAAVELLIKTENTVLVTAPSNTAADLITERLAEKGINVVRIGNISRVDDSVLGHTLDAILAGHPESKNIKKVKIQAAEYRRQARRYKRSFGPSERREREHLKSQARELEAWANDLEDRLVDQVLTSAQAITCTLVGAAHPLLEQRKFRTCVIDEAAQALEPACWIPIAKCSRVVLAGDPFQLPPTVKDLDAARNGLSTTLIERCIELLPERVSLLTVQYRMHQVIMDFSNQYFYGGALQAHESVAERELAPPSPPQRGGEGEAGLSRSGEPNCPTPPLWGGPGGALVFIDTAGCGFDEQLQESSGGLQRSLSRFNPEEGLLIREHLLQLLHQLNGEQTFTPANEGNSPHEIILPSIGVLSPYREQVNYLEALFREDPQLSHLLLPHQFGKAGKDGRHSSFEGYPNAPLPPFGGGRGGLSINTIDGFQGQERDVIYISLVRSNPKHEIGFLQDYRRMNVAMTRARMLLVVVGDSATIGNNKFYQAFLDYCAEHGGYRTAWEFMR